MSISQTASALSSFAQTTPYKSQTLQESAGSSELSAQDAKLLAARGLNNEQQKTVASIYSKARSAVQSGQGKNYLASLDAQSLQALQGAAALADPIHVEALTQEGADNLLLAPSQAIDRNGDGLVETGIARGLQFPPAGASPALRAAWEKTTAGLSDGDVLTLSLQLSGATTAVAVGNAAIQQTAGSEQVNWRSYLEDRIYTNNLGRQFNSSSEYHKLDAQLHSFLAALEEQGLA